MKNQLNAYFVATALCGMILPAHADLSITYTADGTAPQQFAAPTTPPADAPWGVNGYPGDTVQLGGLASTSIALPLGISDQPINTTLWTVNYTYGGTATDPNNWSKLLFSFNESYNITIGTDTKTLSQTGLLDVGWDNDYLSFSTGSTVSFTVGGYEIDVTPDAIAPYGASNFDGDNPWVQPPQAMTATFDVTPVPEPTTIIAGASMLLPFGASTLRILRKKCAV